MSFVGVVTLKEMSRLCPLIISMGVTNLVIRCRDYENIATPVNNVMTIKSSTLLALAYNATLVSRCRNSASDVVTLSLDVVTLISLCLVSS